MPNHGNNVRSVPYSTSYTHMPTSPLPYSKLASIQWRREMGRGEGGGACARWDSTGYQVEDKIYYYY